MHYSDDVLYKVGWCIYMATPDLETELRICLSDARRGTVVDALSQINDSLQKCGIILEEKEFQEIKIHSSLQTHREQICSDIHCALRGDFWRVTTICG